MTPKPLHQPFEAEAEPQMMRHVLLFGLLVFVAAIVTRLGQLTVPPTYDELYHVLAGKSRLADGSLSIYQGAYERTPLYTAFTSWMFALTDEPSLIMARLPNVLFGAMLTAGTALWARSVAGRMTGWVVALFVIFWPSGIHLSQTIRFYAMHGILFFVGAVAVYEMFRPGIGRARQLIALALAIVALWLARQFQDSTLVGVLAMALWVAFFVVLPKILTLKHRSVILTVIVVLALAVLGVLIASGTLGAIWAKYNTSPWGRDALAYHRVLGRFYPLFWVLTPALAILALSRFPRPASFCATLFAVVLVVHSFAGVQNIRYIYYASPFMFALWAMGIAAAAPWIMDMIRKAGEALPGPFGKPIAVTSLATLALLFAVLTQDATPNAIKLVLGKQGAPMIRVKDWSIAREPVQAHARNGALVVATNELAAIHYFGGFDVVFSKNWMPVMNRTEFARDPRTGRPLISELSSLETLVSIYPDGIFVASDLWWRQWPRNHFTGYFMQTFEGVGVSTKMERFGPVWVLQWTNAGPLADDDNASKIREIVDPGKWTP